MQIETKYNIGDKVFVIDKKEIKVKEMEISFIFVDVKFDRSLEVKYGEKGLYESYPEAMCYPTKQELIDYLTRE